MASNKVSNSKDFKISKLSCSKQSNKMDDESSSRTKRPVRNQQTYEHMPEDFHILVAFPDEDKYTILPKSSSSTYFNTSIGSTVIVQTASGKRHKGLLNFKGSHAECKEAEKVLEIEIRNKRNESECRGSDYAEDSETEDVFPNKNIHTDFHKETERLAATLPGLDISILSGDRSINENKRKSERGPEISTPAKRRNEDFGSGSMERLLRSMEKMVEEQKRTNEILLRILNKKSDGGKKDNEEPLVGDFTLEDGTDLAEFARPQNPNKYAIMLAKALWTTDELKSGIVEPQKPNKSKRTLDQARVNKIKALLKHFYPKYGDKMWKSCRCSINQMAQDLKKKEKIDQADEPDDEDIPIVMF